MAFSASGRKNVKKALIFGLCACFAGPLTAARLLDPAYLEAGSNPRGLISADLNGDGFDDAVVASFGSATLIGQACPAEAGALQVYRGSANGLVLQQTLPLPGDAPRGLASADLNGDGRPDLLATLYCSGRLAVFLQAADGSFGQPQLYAVGAQPVGVAVQAPPSRAWVAVANYGASTVSLFSAFAGTLTPIATHPAATSPTDLEFYGPASGGETLLLVAAYGSNQLLRLSLNADGALLSSQATAMSGQPCKVVVGDINGDGHLDAAVARFTDSAISVFLGHGAGLAPEAVSVSLQGSHPNGLALGRLGAALRLVAADRDSDHAEVLSWTPQGLSSSARVLIPDADGNTAAFGPVETALGDVNGDGRLDILVTHMRSGRLAVILQGPEAAPQVSSSSHPDAAGWSPATELRAAWSAAAGGLDPVQGFRVVLDQQPGTVPSAGTELRPAGEAVFSGLASGEHWLHVQAVGADGLPGGTTHYRVGVTASFARENVYNYPNPSRDGRTTIRFPLLQPAPIEIRIYDEAGALVWSRDLSAEQSIAGVNTVLWDGRNGQGREVANGGYVLTVKAGDALVTKKIAIIR
jgi:hypothetical protein